VVDEGLLTAEQVADLLVPESLVCPREMLALTTTSDHGPEKDAIA
jgi:hypothetical protein